MKIAEMAVAGRTIRKHDSPNDGVFVDFVHGSIREDSMAEWSDLIRAAKRKPGEPVRISGRINPREDSMTNDNNPTPRPLAGRFATALEELVGICHDAGLHSSEMIEPLRYWLRWAEDASKASDGQ